MDEYECLCITPDFAEDSDGCATCRACGVTVFPTPGTLKDEDAESLMLSSWAGPRAAPAGSRYLRLYIMAADAHHLRSQRRASRMVELVDGAANSLTVDAVVRREARDLARSLSATRDLRLGQAAVPVIYAEAFKKAGRPRTLSELSDMFGVPSHHLERRAARLARAPGGPPPTNEPPPTDGPGTTEVEEAHSCVRPFLDRAANAIGLTDSAEILDRAAAMAKRVLEENKSPRFVAPLLAMGCLSTALNNERDADLVKHAAALGFSENSFTRVRRSCRRRHKAWEKCNT